MGKEEGGEGGGERKGREEKGRSKAQVEEVEME